MTDPKKDFRILSLDGGGIRGAFIAGFLNKLATELGAPLHQHFDLIAGTSTGGIIAAALALGIEPKTIVDFYVTAGPKIFVPRQVEVPMAYRVMQKAANWAISEKIGAVDLASLFATKYDSAVLKSTLTEVFGNAKVKDAKCLLTIPAVDVSKGQTVVIKTGHLPGLTRDPERQIVDVLLATAAAPTYFPHATIEPGSAFVDGGLWANNPALVAYAEAVRIHREQAGVGAPTFDRANIRMLSIGTGKQSYSIDPPGSAAGFGFWMEHLIDVMGNSQSQGVDFAMRYLLPADNYVRVDFDISDKSWKLDNALVVDRLAHIGREKCVERLTEFKKAFAPHAVAAPQN